jgi:hypothetical protein
VGEEYFTGSLSRSQRISTAMLLICLACTFAVVAVMIVRDSGLVRDALFLLIPLAPVAVLLAETQRYAPKQYAVSPDGIAIVRRNGKRIVLPRNEVTAVEATEVKRCIRGCGVGGWFGSWGYFWSPALGGFRAYVTDFSKPVLVRTRSKGLYVVSPDDRDGFVAAANEVLDLG